MDYTSDTFKATMCFSAIKVSFSPAFLTNGKFEIVFEIFLKLCD